jgi:hypothetical protein
MGLGIYAMDRFHNRLDHIVDDTDDSFRKMCEAAPWKSLRRGVMRFGETYFNRVQLMRLKEELDSLPAEDRSPVVEEVAAFAQLAIRHNGFLYFQGD